MVEDLSRLEEGRLGREVGEESSFFPNSGGKDFGTDYVRRKRKMDHLTAVV